MEIRSPKVVDTHHRVKFENSKMYEFTHPVLDVTVTKKISILTVSEQRLDNGQVDFQIFTHVPTSNQLIHFEAMQSLIKACVDNAEDIKSRLLQILLSTLPTSKIEERAELMNKPFMNLKGQFMDHIRTEKVFKIVDEFNSTKKLKPFSKAFNTFILDRNKYTHGLLHFLTPNFDFVLEYNDGDNQKYAYINIEILKSYNDFYKEILRVLKIYNLIKQGNLIDK